MFYLNNIDSNETCSAEDNLYLFNNVLGEHVNIFSILISSLLALMYIDYISEDEIKFSKINLSKIGKIIHFIVIVSVTWSILILFSNLIIFKPILCDTTDSDNQQTNQNTQNSNNNSNAQTNGNNQTSNQNNNVGSERVRTYGSIKTHNTSILKVM